MQQILQYTACDLFEQNELFIYLFLVCSPPHFNVIWYCDFMEKLMILNNNPEICPFTLCVCVFFCFNNLNFLFFKKLDKRNVFKLKFMEYFFKNKTMFSLQFIYLFYFYRIITSFTNITKCLSAFLKIKLLKYKL